MNVLWMNRFADIRPMKSYRDAANAMGKVPDVLYTETSILPLALLQRLQKYFPFRQIKSADASVMAVRSIKSKYELEIMIKAGGFTGKYWNSGYRNSLKKE